MTNTAALEKQRKALSTKVHEARLASGLTIAQASELVTQKTGRSKGWYESREYHRGPITDSEAQTILKIFDDAAMAQNAPESASAVAEEPKETVQRSAAPPQDAHDFLLAEAKQSLVLWLQSTHSMAAIAEVARIKRTYPE